MPRRSFAVRRSPLHGHGAFATEVIPAGTRLIEYVGERLSPAQAEARYPEIPGVQHTMLFAIDDDVVIDAAVNGNAARWINHSCDPNCDAVVDDRRIWIETIRDVLPGEELTYDYELRLETRHTPTAKRMYACSCGSPRCRGTLLISKRHRPDRRTGR
jgi:uncharacterized protein